MKIKGNYNKGSTTSVNSSTGNVNAGKKSGSARESQSKSTEAVHISSTGGLSAAMSNSAAGRADKVARIKLEVESGSYEMDSQKTADKLIDSLTDYSLA